MSITDIFRQWNFERIIETIKSSIVLIVLCSVILYTSYECHSMLNASILSIENIVRDELIKDFHGKSIDYIKNLPEDYRLQDFGEHELENVSPHSILIRFFRKSGKVYAEFLIEDNNDGEINIKTIPVNYRYHPSDRIKW